MVVVTRRHRRRRHRIPSRRHPLHHRHQPSLAAVLSITFGTPVDGWLLHSPPALKSLSREVSREESLTRSLLQGVSEGVSRKESKESLVRSDDSSYLK